MLGLQDILLEGRIDDARQYIENAVGFLSDKDEEVLGYFIDGDPSGNHKYLMWMVKMFDTDSGFSPNMLIDLVERFHNNVDRLTPAFITDMDFEAPNNRILTSPKNIDSYDTFRELKMVVDEIGLRQTRKQKETEAKAGVDKLYEDERWLLVKPNTYEGSCYYGSSTKWCTAAKNNTTHFEDYSERGNLYYIIDKSHELGDYYKIALFKEWGGNEEWYDRADDRIEQGAINAIRSTLPQDLIIALDYDHDEMEEPEKELMLIPKFQQELNRYINAFSKNKKITTQSGVWELEVESRSGTWTWTSLDNEGIQLMATPFWDGQDGIPFSSIEPEFVDAVGPEAMETEWVTREKYLDPTYNQERMYGGIDANINMFLNHIYYPLVKKQLNRPIFKQAVGGGYKTWMAQSYVSTFTFKYPPREGTMTQKFVDYIKQNPRRTANQFYEDVLGYPRPRAHNNMFFSSIKDAGIVKLERQGRQFVYSLGPNYQD